MSIIETINIDQDHVKTRWEEPYISAAVNKQLGAMPRGVYRGFMVEEQSTPALGVTIKASPADDQLLVVRDADGYAVAIHYDDDFDLTLDNFPGGSPFFGWLWCAVSYSVSGATTAVFQVGETLDVPDYATVVCQLQVPAGATAITNSMIRQGVDSPGGFRTSPIPQPGGEGSKDDFGFVDYERWLRFPSQDQKDAMDNASPAATGLNPFLTETTLQDRYFAKPSTQVFTGNYLKVQLSGWWYVGEGGTGTPNKWFGVYEGFGGIANDMEMVDGNSDPITVTTVYRDDGLTTLNPSTDATDGYYEDPYVEFNTTTISGWVTIFGGKRTRYEDLETNEFFDRVTGVQNPYPAEIQRDFKEVHDRLPTTYTVSADADDKTNWSGPSSLQSALTSLASNGGGVVYVKKGDYTLDALVTSLYPITIMCEGSGEDSGSRVRLTASGSGELRLLGGCTIRGLEMRGGFGLEYSFSGDRVTLIDCISNVSLQIADYTTYLTMRNVRVVIENSGDHCVKTGTINEAIALIWRAEFDNCYFDGTNAQASSGGGVNFGAVTTSIQYLAFENVICTARGTSYWAMNLPYGAASLKLKNMDLQHVAISTSAVDASYCLHLEADGPMRATLDNVAFSVDGTGVLYPYMLAQMILNGDQGQISARNLHFNGGNIPIGIIENYKGLIWLSASASSAHEANRIMIDGMVIYGFGGASSNTRDRWIGVQAADVNSQVHVRGLEIMSAYNNAAYDDLTVIEVARAGAGDPAENFGKIIVEDSNINLAGFPTTGTVYGVLMNTNAYQSRPGGLILRNVWFNNIVDQHILINHGYFELHGVHSGQDGVNGLARWDINGEAGGIVEGCHYEYVSGTIPVILDLSANADAVAIMNNILKQDGSSNAIQIGNGATKVTVFGNVGSGVIRSYVANTTKGIGDDASVAAYNANVGFTITIT